MAEIKETPVQIDLGWTCPECGSDSLDVNISTWARLEQSEAGPDYVSTDTATAQFQDHEWDGNSPMQCRDCGHCDRSDKFRVGFKQEVIGS